MKAAVVREFGKPLEIEEVPIPQPSPGQVLVKVRACGVCGTDLHAASGNWPVKPNPPFIPGHEGVGERGGRRPRGGWLVAVGPYACPSKQDLRQITKHLTDETELQTVDYLTE